MKSNAPETLLAGVWGLNFTSYIMQSMPYLQAASLVLAIVVSLLTIRKLVRESKKKEKESEE